ncbi:hypothetical protein NJE55_12550 [Stutzerimonas xanthomarina]|nr:hypothetical protein [Stutzerimonas xanthomarina]
MQARIASKLAPTGAGETIVLQARLAIAQAQADFVGASLLAIGYGEELMGKQLGVALQLICLERPQILADGRARSRPAHFFRQKKPRTSLGEGEVRGLNPERQRRIQRSANT